MSTHSDRSTRRRYCWLRLGANAGEYGHADSHEVTTRHAILLGLLLVQIVSGNVFIRELQDAMTLSASAHRMIVDPQ